MSPELFPMTLDCVHCGLCLPVCPTYRETGRETSSPRGRVYLMRGVAEGTIPLGEVVAEEAYACLGCRACETACPSGVRFGALLTLTRAQVEDAKLRRGWRKVVESVVLRAVIPHPRRLHTAVNLLGWVQRRRLDRLAARWLPEALGRSLRSAPPVPRRAERQPLPERIPSQGEHRGRVGLFVGCVMPEIFGAVNAATARVLALNGFEVWVVRDQGCCGALQAHAGDLKGARDLLRANVAAFGALGLDAVVVNSAGCGAFLREAGEWLPDGGEALAGSVRDVMEFLDERGLRPPPHSLPLRVCYDDPCHLVHAQRVEAAPRRLLCQIEGLELVAHDDPAGCCGAAGIYSFTHGEMSAAILQRKMESLAAAAPDVIASGNPGCLIQFRAGAEQFGLSARVAHPIELLAEAYGQR